MQDNTWCWSLDTIGLLDEQAFETTAPIPDEASFSVTLWYQTETLERRQVIANQGRDERHDVGWAIGVEAAHVFFELCLQPGHVLRLRLPHRSQSADTDCAWHFAAVVLDADKGEMVLYHNEQMTKAPMPQLLDVIEPRLRIGGYTDPAGGHYNYTFGRYGTGIVGELCIYRRVLGPSEIHMLLPRNVIVPAFHLLVDGSSTAPTLVRLRVTTDNADTIRAVVWDFGDGQRGLGVEVEHEFNYAGTYNVRATVVSQSYDAVTTSYSLVLAGLPNPVVPKTVFRNGELGCACFRIPSLVRSTTGKLLAFAEGRVESCSDSTPTIVGVLSSSSDNGQTWSKAQIVFRNEWRGQIFAVQNISPVVDTVYNTGKIVVVYNAVEHSEWDIARGNGISRTYCCTSDDDGKTWSESVDITAQVHRPFNLEYGLDYPPASRSENQAHDWRIQRPTLGHAIQLQRGKWRGRIVHSGMFSTREHSVFQSQNYIFYSDDLGNRWQIAGILPQGGLNEASLAELDDGSILISSRAYNSNDMGMGCRALTRISFDEAGVMHSQPTKYDNRLIDPAVQASLFMCTASIPTHPSVLLFANPAHPNTRLRMTVRGSLDGGRTWPMQRIIDNGASAYSDIACDGAGQVTLIYERGNEGGIVSVTFSLAWLLASASPEIEA